VPLKSLLVRFIVTLALLTTFSMTAVAAPPALTPSGEFPTSVVPGHQYVFHLNYKQAEGDAPQTAQMIVDTPAETEKIKAFPPAGDPVAGEDLSWNFSPQQSGQYQYHFEVTSATGGVARYPAGSGELAFESPNPIVKYIVLGVGLLVALFFLPFVVYMLARATNKRSDPGAAARIALLIGILAFCGLAWYLFLQNEETRGIGIGIEAIALGAFLVVILNRRKTA
jgi:hypothetical protein